MFNINVLENGLGIDSPLHFAYDFSKKDVCHVLFYQLTKFQCLIALSS